MLLRTQWCLRKKNPPDPADRLLSTPCQGQFMRNVSHHTTFYQASSKREHETNKQASEGAETFFL